MHDHNSRELYSLLFFVYSVINISIRTHIKQEGSDYEKEK